MPKPNITLTDEQVSEMGNGFTAFVKQEYGKPNEIIVIEVEPFETSPGRRITYYRNTKTKKGKIQNKRVFGTRTQALRAIQISHVHWYKDPDEAIDVILKCQKAIDDPPYTPQPYTPPSERRDY